MERRLRGRKMDNKIFKCRICGSSGKYNVILNADVPLTTQVLDRPSKDMKKYPLRVVRCCTCGHVQLRESLDVNLYDNYLYTPSYASEFEHYIEKFVDKITAYVELQKVRFPKVLEIGSSNGYLLEKMRNRGWIALGIEPSATLASESLKRGVDTIKGYFGLDTVNKIIKRLGGNPDVIVIRHVMEHLEDLDTIVESIRRILGDGLLLIEVPYLKKMIVEKQFYAFFHEHLSYYSVTALYNLLKKVDFQIHRVYENSLEGGSILICANSNLNKLPNDNVEDYLRDEKDTLSERRLNEFAKGTHSFIKEIRHKIQCATSNGMKIAAWGAGQRGCTLISLCGLGSDDLQYVIDVNENYWWKFVPGTDIQIVPPDYYEKNFVDGILIFATGYADSIIKQNKAYEELGGSFIKIIT